MSTAAASSWVIAAALMKRLAGFYPRPTREHNITWFFCVRSRENHFLQYYQGLSQIKGMLGFSMWRLIIARGGTEIKSNPFNMINLVEFLWMVSHIWLLVGRKLKATPPALESSTNQDNKGEFWLCCCTVPAPLDNKGEFWAEDLGKSITGSRGEVMNTSRPAYIIQASTTLTHRHRHKTHIFIIIISVYHQACTPSLQHQHFHHYHCHWDKNQKRQGIWAWEE